MYKGKSTKGVEFYNLLFENDEFTNQLGKVALAAGKLEAEIVLYFGRKGVTVKVDGATLGHLIRVGKAKSLFDNNLFIALQMVCEQRNYFTHNIYSLFRGLKEEKILPKNNLIDTDVLTYIDYVSQLRENLEGLAELIKLKNN